MAVAWWKWRIVTRRLHETSRMQAHSCADKAGGLAMVFDAVFASVCSQMVLALCVTVIWRTLTRQPDLAGRLAHVREYVSRRARVAKSRVALERGLAERAALGKLLDRTRHLVRDRIDPG